MLTYNAKGDKDYRIDVIFDKYLRHITNVKSITARQHIKLLPIIAKYENDILSAFHYLKNFAYSIHIPKESLLLEYIDQKTNKL